MEFYRGETFSLKDGEIETSGVAVAGTGESPYQIFTVNTGEINDGDSLSVSWSGKANNIDNSHLLKMYAKNVNTGKWTEIGTADSNGNINAMVNASDYVEEQKATLLVQVVTKGSMPKIRTADASGAQMSDWEGTKRPDTYVLRWHGDGYPVLCRKFSVPL